MDSRGKTAILLGATGFIGKFLLQLLLKDKRYALIKVFGRRSVGFSHPKLQEHIADLLDMDSIKDRFTADEVFCCIGTTKKRTPDKGRYRAIDHGIPTEAAALAQANHIHTFLVLSALGAKPESSIFYNRTKGEMERDIINCGIPKTHILKPSILSGKRKEFRPGEWLMKQLMRALNVVMVGSLRKFRSIHPKEVALCMFWLANNPYDKVRIESDEIKELVSHHLVK